MGGVLAEGEFNTGCDPFAVGITLPSSYYMLGSCGVRLAALDYAARKKYSPATVIKKYGTSAAAPA